MEIALNEIVKLLTAWEFATIMADNEEAWISDIVLVDDGIHEINPNLLYLCDTIQFKKISKIKKPGNILINSCDKDSMNTADNTCFNIVCVKSQLHNEELYLKIRTLFEEKRELERKKRNW